MAINPALFARTVNEQFLRYQLTAFPLTDEPLARQAETAIRGTADQPASLIKGPYLTLSKVFKMGPSVAEVIARETVHPAIAGILEHPTLFAHQWETIEAARAGRHCLVSTGTGSGKTEAFLIPILDHCLRLRDRKAPDGVVAVIVYPMNALAVDQPGRLRRMLVGTGISFGMYVGSTAADEGELENVVRMKPGEGKAEFARYVQRHRAHERVVISPPEDGATRRSSCARETPSTHRSRSSPKARTRSASSASSSRAFEDRIYMWTTDEIRVMAPPGGYSGAVLAQPS